MSFGTEAATFAEPLLFSVDGPSAGVPGAPPDVASEAGAGDHPADIYVAGTLAAPLPNKLFADGDGSAFGAAPATGLMEPADDLAAMSSCDATSASAFGIPTFFTLAPGSPAIAALAAAPEDIFITPLGSGGPPALFIPGAAAIGLMPGDLIDAMATDFLIGPGTLIFSLAPGSPTLGFLGLGPEDLLIWVFGPPGPAPFLPGAALGLAPGDNIDALDAPADADADAVGDVCDNCIAAPNNDQADLDGDGPGDACDTCTDTDGDGFGNPGFPNICPIDTCEGFDDAMDADADTVPDGCDICPGFDDTLDADGDMVPDGCDPCSNLGPGQDITVKPKIQLKKINTDVTPGNDGFVMKGEFVLPTGPAPSRCSTRRPRARAFGSTPRTERTSSTKRCRRASCGDRRAPGPSGATRTSSVRQTV
jgi:hypothetical protein